VRGLSTVARSFGDGPPGILHMPGSRSSSKEAAAEAEAEADRSAATYINAANGPPQLFVGDRDIILSILLPYLLRPTKKASRS
jgi:hypothetical protein